MLRKGVYSVVISLRKVLTGSEDAQRQRLGSTCDSDIRRLRSALWHAGSSNSGGEQPYNGNIFREDEMRQQLPPEGADRKRIEGDIDPLGSDIALHVTILRASKNRFFSQLSIVTETALRFSIRMTNEFNGLRRASVDDHRNNPRACRCS